MIFRKVILTISLLSVFSGVYGQLNQDYVRLFNDGRYDILVTILSTSAENNKDNAKLLADVHYNRAITNYYGYLLLLNATKSFVERHPTINNNQAGRSLLAELQIRELLVRNNSNQTTQFINNLDLNNHWRSKVSDNPILNHYYGTINSFECTLNKDLQKDCSILKEIILNGDLSFTQYRQLTEYQNSFFLASVKDRLDQINSIGHSARDLTKYILNLVDQFWILYLSDLKASLILYDHIESDERYLPYLNIGKNSLQLGTEPLRSNNPRIRLIHSVSSTIGGCKNLDSSDKLLPDKNSGTIPYAYTIVLLNSCIASSHLNKISKSTLSGLKGDRRDEVVTLSRALVAIEEEKMALNILNRFMSRSIVFDIRRAEPLGIAVSAYLRFNDGKIENLNDARRQLSILQDNIKYFSTVFLFSQLATLPDITKLGTNPSLYIE
jgi:hypothetical protein